MAHIVISLNTESKKSNIVVSKKLQDTFSNIVETIQTEDFLSKKAFNQVFIVSVMKIVGLNKSIIVDTQAVANEDNEYEIVYTISGDKAELISVMTAAEAEIKTLLEDINTDEDSECEDESDYEEDESDYEEDESDYEEDESEEDESEEDESEEDEEIEASENDTDIEEFRQSMLNVIKQEIGALSIKEFKEGGQIVISF